MKDIVLATRNPHKTRELSAIFQDAGLHIRLRSLTEFAGAPDVEEDGRTLEENALKKAASAARATGYPALADDTGLEVAALGGAPGVFSARYAGPGCDYAANNEKLLRDLAGVPRESRKAAFRCAICLCGPSGKDARHFEGRLDGVISEQPAGTNGFGYDPIFFLPEQGATLAELPTGEKNRISHRAKALEALVRHLRFLEAAPR
jgi:XTP/dITP diphosphohydrolase